MKIFINPGHAPNGNPDPGATNKITGLRESDVADDISQGIMYYLQQACYDVLVMQDDDLQKVCDKSNEFNSDLFISVHCNDASNKSARGTETFAHAPGGNGELLAKCVQKQIIDSVGTIDRGVKFANYQVLRQTNCPAILVETEFIDNAEGGEMLSDEMFINLFARAIARGITDYIADLA